MKKKIYIGTAYYPEHWPRERWAEDVALMKKAGINVVRLAELAWSFLEPEEGRYDFAWLDSFIDLAFANGIETVLGTPTEITPTWMNVKYPEVIAVNREGRTQGGRGNHCYNSKKLNVFTERMVEEMAWHYRDNPAVIGWQIDNELRGTKCYCPACQEGYREFLKEQYGTLDELNRQWGTCFWSQVYHSWEEVALPSEDQLTVSTSQILDHFRFASRSTVGFLDRQAKIIKETAPHQFVSHNSLGLCEWVNLYDMGACLDEMGLDSYPYVDDDNLKICMAHDLARGVKQKSYWIWEQKNGYVNYHTYNLAIEPGLVRLWTWQDIARGANGVVYYRWRSNRFNYEQNPNGILRHDGSPRRVYEEIAKVSGELEEFGERLADCGVKADAAILYSYEQMWDEYSNKQYQNITYQEILLSYYKAFLSLGLTVDLVDWRADLTRYPLVAAPGLAVMNGEMADKLKEYAQGGGCLLLGVRSGIKTWTGAITDLPWPGMVAELAGIGVEEFEVLPPEYHNRVSFQGKEYSVTGWIERLTPKTAKPQAFYCENFYAKEAAVSLREIGDGKVWYIGVMGCDDLVKTIVKQTATELGLPAFELPAGVFLTRREGAKERFYFLVNHNRKRVGLKLPVIGKELLTKRAVAGEIVLEPLDVAVIHTEHEESGNSVVK